MDKWYYYAVSHDCNFFSHRFPSICSWESCTLTALFGSPGLFVPYSCDHVQRPWFAPDKYTCKHTPFWGFAKLCMFHLSPGLSFLSRRATQHFGGSSLCILSLLSHNTVRWAQPQPRIRPRLICLLPIDTWDELDASCPAKGENMNTHGAKCFPQAVWMDQAETGLSTLEILENSKWFVPEREQHLLLACRLDWTGRVFITAVRIHSWDPKYTPSARTYPSVYQKHTAI